MTVDTSSREKCLRRCMLLTKFHETIIRFPIYCTAAADGNFDMITVFKKAPDQEGLQSPQAPSPSSTFDVCYFSATAIAKLNCVLALTPDKHDKGTCHMVS